MMSLSRLWILCGGMALVLACLDTAMAQTQSQGSGQTQESPPSGVGQPPGQAGSSDVVRGSSGGSFSRVVPLVTFSERYDTNVFFSPEKISDFVTSIRPGARMEYRDDLVDGSLTGGAVAEFYARTPELNYVGGNAILSGSFDNLVGRMVRGLGLRILDSFIYTPQGMAFVTPQAPETSFLRGIQAVRNNYLSNSANIMSTYAMTPVALFNASYSNQIMRFFNQSFPSAPGTTPPALFDTTVNVFTAGPQYLLSGTESIGASYMYQKMDFEPNTGGGAGYGVATHGVMATWKSSFTREWTIELSPGVTVLTTLPDTLIWTMRAMMAWTDGRTSAGLTYSRGVYPSFFVSASALISNVVNATFSHNLSSQWSLSAQANYGYNESTGGVQGLRFESYDFSAAVNYAISQGMVASLTITQGNYSYGQAGFPDVKFDRQTAVLYLTAEWN